MDGWCSRGLRYRGVVDRPSDVELVAAAGMEYEYVAVRDCVW